MPSRARCEEGQVVDVPSLEEDFAALRGIAPGQDLKQARLAGAVRADDPQHFALTKLEADIAQHFPPAQDRARDPRKKRTASSGIGLPSLLSPPGGRAQLRFGDFVRPDDLVIDRPAPARRAGSCPFPVRPPGCRSRCRESAALPGIHCSCSSCRRRRDTGFSRIHLQLASKSSGFLVASHDRLRYWTMS